MTRWPITRAGWAAPPTLETPDERVLTYARLRAGPFNIGLRAYRSDFAQPRHEHEHAVVDFNLAGSGRGVLLGAESASVPGTVEPLGPRVAHDFRAGPEGIRTLHVSIHPDELPEGSPLRAAATAPHRDFDHAAALRAALVVLKAALRPDERDLSHAEAAAWGLFEAVWPQPNGFGASACVRRAVECLHGVHDRPLGLAELASACGVHRGTLARAFRARLGTTPGEYHRRLRAARAASLMARGVPAAVAAMDCGFADQPHFVRTLVRCCGTTPGRFTGLIGAERGGRRRRV